MAGEVVLGYDGVSSGAALETATQIAAAFKRPLVIVFGYQPAALIGGETGDLRKAIKELGETFTAEATETAHKIDPSVEIKVELVDNRPAEAILEAADAYDALAVVVGATSRGPVTGAMLGSVTYNVVHRSTRPVVVVPTPPDADADDAE